MRTTHRAAILVALCTVTAHAQPGALRIDARFTSAANMFYQIDCVAKVNPYCARADYAALWQRDFMKAAADSTAVAEWGALRRRYQVSMSPTPAAGTAADRPIDVSDRLRIASLQSTDLADLLPRLEILLTSADWLVARRILQHFEPFFMTWWARDAIPVGQPFVERTNALFASDSVRGAIARFAHFYGTVFPLDAGVPMQLFLRPGLIMAGTSGQQIERYAVLEFLPAESPSSRIDVAVHELCHFFFESRDETTKRALERRFRTSTSPAATAAFNLLNEGLATALGNGLLARLVDSARYERRAAMPMGFYNNPHIDKAGRVLLSIIGPRVAHGGTMDDADFTPAYIAAIDSAFGPSATAPALLLNELYFFGDAAFGPNLRLHARQALRASSMYDQSGAAATAMFDEFVRMPTLSALFVVTSTGIEALVRAHALSSADAVVLRRRVKAKSSALYWTRRASGAWTYVIVAGTAATAQQEITRLAAMTSTAVSAR